MINLSKKNILIYSNLRAERVLFFNFFDNNEAEMIYSAKDMKNCCEILNQEEIDYLILEYSFKGVNNLQQLTSLIKENSNLKIALVIDKEIQLTTNDFECLTHAVNTVFIEPISKLEVNIKLEELCNVNSKPQQALRVNDTVNNDGKHEELWELFFENSIHAGLIVNARSQKIIRVNESLLELIQHKETDIIGQPWYVLDAKDNRQCYNQYIKEINTQEKVQFFVNYTHNNKKQKLEAEYQMGVLDGEIVYIGIISAEKLQGLSNEVFQNFNTINQLEKIDRTFQTTLDIIRVSLKFKFLIFIEYQDKKLLKPIISGDKIMIKNFLTRSLENLKQFIGNNEELELDRTKNRTSKYCETLDINNLQSLCIYPINHQNKTYGSIIAGGLEQIDNWQTISVLLKSLVNQCRFILFNKKIVNQRELDGQVDSLTGLPNRNSMTNKFAKIMGQGIDADKYLSLMIIDIEKLNYLNKNIGIGFTDEIIVCISRIIVQCIRNKGQVYRLSADEFLVLMQPHKGKELAKQKVLELISKLKKPILLSNGTDIDVNFNIGISIFPDDGQTVSSMMKNADLAMYDAKLAGKNNYVIFKHSETGQALKQKTEMEENLKIAIEHGDIKVYYQPKINAVTEDIMGFEALVRWVDPEIGMINPGHFIPLAEETGLINKIGEYVTKQSCKMIVEWQKKFGLALSCSINLSAVQLIESKLPKLLETIINDSGVHPRFIDFEITETISLDVVPNLVESLNEIVEFGCTLSIDDFGTGHSSLDYIKKIPAKYIKIDQSFVRNIGLNPEDEAILDATINIAKRLNRKIVAEGVETEEQREYLLDRGCEYFQGFLFARPMPEEEIEKLLTQRVQLMGTG